MKLLSIDQEEALCRAAFEAHPEATFAWCRGHLSLIDPLSPQGWEGRITTILTVKPKREQARRLHEFRPVIGELPEALVRARAEVDRARAEVDRARAEYDRAGTEAMPLLETLHRAECPDSAWDGVSIFGKGETA